MALLHTFADQAVIAIENVRLFKELEAANGELAAASQHKSEFPAIVRPAVRRQEDNLRVWADSPRRWALP